MLSIPSVSKSYAQNGTSWARNASSSSGVGLKVRVGSVHLSLPVNQRNALLRSEVNVERHPGLFWTKPGWKEGNTLRTASMGRCSPAKGVCMRAW